MSENLKTRILNHIQQKKQVSFVDIQHMEGGAGDTAIELGDDTNVMLWTGLSKEAVRAVIELRAEGLIEYDPTEKLTYFLDGAMLDMPVAKSPTAIERGYKKPHWLPVLLNPTEKAVALAAQDTNKVKT